MSEGANGDTSAPGGRVTLRAVAARAGVSTMTVSNVINRAGKASPATVAMVRAAIDELGYVPNLAARRLASGRPTTIGLLYPHRRTPFLDAILTGTLRAANAQHFQLVVRDGAGEDVAEAIELARGLVQQGGADALILVPPFAELLGGNGALRQLGVPAAAIATGAAIDGLRAVRIDNRAATRAIVAHLIERGHHNIGFIGGPASHTVSRERRDGFFDTLAEYGIAADEYCCVDGAFTFDSGVAAARVLLDRADPPSAIVASSDDMAAGVLHEAQRRGMRLPQDLAVTGFDDTSVAHYTWPSLTAIRQPVEQMAHRAAEKLIALLQRSETESFTDEILDHELVVRESTSVRRSAEPVSEFLVEAERDQRRHRA